ncbi:glutamate-5-semialdehyde dehydrogenase [soil metagenome]
MSSSLAEQINDIGQQARRASRALATLPPDRKNAILVAMADELVASSDAILSANARDINSAEHHGLNKAALDRLRLTRERITKMADDIRQVALLTDPVGQAITEWTRPNGLRISKVRVPIGVVGIIYESRPNVTSDAAVLCIKTGNATILRGGSESIYSNLAIVEALQAGGAVAGLPEHSIQLIPTTDRDAVRLMAQMDKYIDLIVPRGGHSLIEAVVSHARMPVIKHYHGVCHVYVDKDADFDMAESIVVNAKSQRPGVCNSLETLLVHRDVAEAFLQKAGPAFASEKIEIRGDEATRNILGDQVVPATEEDWSTEYLDLIMSVRVVDDLEEAVDHMEKYGSHHSDAIVTRDAVTAERFLAEVDSATVYWNASTRFTDGGEFGFGAEIGISTDKLHARGPMGLEELTTYKYLIRGQGQIRT